MRSIDIGTFRLIAKGGQADIYDCGDGKVIRVPRRAQDYDRIRYEYEVYVLLSGTTIAAPKAFELVEVNGAPSIVMERILGPSMMDDIRKQPYLIRRKATDLANMHRDLLGVTAAASMTNSKDQAKYCINRSQSLTEDTKQVLMNVLEQLPEGASLCHGDFHPGNILHSGGKRYIIDWSGATKGDLLYDIAHTYILLRVVPRVPGTGLFMHGIQKLLGKVMASIYLRTIMKHLPIDASWLSKWVLIKAAERTYYGLSSEKERLRAFVSKYAIAIFSGKSKANFYKQI